MAAATTETGYAVPLEEYLIGPDCSADSGRLSEEGSQGTGNLARTALYREMDGADSIEESALDMDYLEPEQIESRFEAAGMPEYYQTICGAVRRAQDRRRSGLGIILSRCFMQ